MKKICTIVLYGESQGGEYWSHLSVISEYSIKDTINKAAKILHKEGDLDIVVYLNGVLAHRDTNSAASYDNEGNEHWTQEIEDEAKLIVDSIKGEVHERREEEKRIKKEQEERKKQEAAKREERLIQEKELAKLKMLMDKYPVFSKNTVKEHEEIAAMVSKNK